MKRLSKPVVLIWKLYSINIFENVLQSMMRLIKSILFTSELFSKHISFKIEYIKLEFIIRFPNFLQFLRRLMSVCLFE